MNFRISTTHRFRFLTFLEDADEEMQVVGGSKHHGASSAFRCISTIATADSSLPLNGNGAERATRLEFLDRCECRYRVMREMTRFDVQCFQVQNVSVESTFDDSVRSFDTDVHERLNLFSCSSTA